MVQAQAEHVAFADDAERAAERRRSAWRVHARLAVDDVHAIANAVERDPVTDAENIDFDGARTVGRGRVGQRHRVIAIEHVAVLVRDPRAQAACSGNAGVVRRHEKPLRIFLGHLHFGVDFAFFFAHAKRDLDLLGRIFIRQLNVLGHAAQVRYGAYLQRWESGEHVVRAEIRVSADDHPCDDAFGDLQADHAAGELLLGHIDLHGAVALLAVSLVKSFERFLNIAVDTAGTHERRKQAVDFRFGEQRVALHLETNDVEALILSGTRHDACHHKKEANRVPQSSYLFSRPGRAHERESTRVVRRNSPLPLCVESIKRLDYFLNCSFGLNAGLGHRESRTMRSGIRNRFCGR